MKILEARAAFLTNYEVAAHLTQLTAQQDAMLEQGSYSSALESENLRTVQFELKAYLDSQPCHLVTPENMRDLLLRLGAGDWHLTKVEKLMLVNQVPGNEAEISVLLEEYADRFSDTQRSRLIEVLADSLGQRESVGNGDTHMADAESEQEDQAKD